MSKMNIVDLCGIVSSVIIVVMFIPEIYHVYKHKDAKAINYSFLHLNVISSVRHCNGMNILGTEH